jgi:hypothetical protein
MITETQRARLEELDWDFTLAVIEDAKARTRIDAIFAQAEQTDADEHELLELDKLRDVLHVRKNGLALEAERIRNPRLYRRR